MKRITVLAFLTAALISMASARAHAQAPAFTVSFDFTVARPSAPRRDLSGQATRRRTRS